MSLHGHALFMNDGTFIDDAGNLITTTFVDLRAADQRTSIHTLAKASRREYALETSPTLRIAKPADFRESGGGLIRDPNEGRATTRTDLLERIDHPDDLTEANARNQEIMRAAKLAGSMLDIRRTTTSTKVTESQGSSIKYGHDWWIYSTSMLEPGAPPPRDWLESLDPEYEHISWIRRPRTFAHALGAMAAAKLGPQLDETQMTHKLKGGEQCVSNHGLLWVVHGPIVYVDDAYETLRNWEVESTHMFALLFVKERDSERDHAALREYRFAVLTQGNPLSEVLLPISPALRSTLCESPNPMRSSLSLCTVTGTDHVETTDQMGEADTRDDNADRKSSATRYHSAAEDIDFPPFGRPFSDPSVPTRPDIGSFAAQHRHTDGMLECYAWLSVLGNSVEGVDVNDRLEAASAAWNAQQPIHDLLQEFEHPIKSVRIRDSAFVDLCFDLPPQSRSDANLVIGPLGCFALSIRRDGAETLLDGKRWFGIGAPIRSLRDAGLAPRKHKVAQ